jgi:hypothetical protein
VSSLEEDHAQGALLLLQGNENLIAVFDGAVSRPAPDPPYVVVYTKVGFPKDGVGTALDAVQSSIATTITCHCVGETAVATRTVARLVRETLLNARPVINGRNCSPIKQTDAADVSHPDDTTGKQVFDVALIFEYMSTG